jgi:hypothetical protein
LEQKLRQGLLTPVRVPVQLLPGEYACYRTEATRCGEPVSTASEQGRRKVKDHGTLIFTNERMIYLGRRGQIMLEYAHLLYVSRLRRAVVFSAEHWTQSEIFELPRPLECTMYLEHILQRCKCLREPRSEGVRAVQPIGQYMIQTCPASEGAGLQPSIEEIDTVQFVCNEPEVLACEKTVEETR